RPGGSGADLEEPQTPHLRRLRLAGGIDLAFLGAQRDRDARADPAIRGDCSIVRHRAVDAQESFARMDRVAAGTVAKAHGAVQGGVEELRKLCRPVSHFALVWPRGRAV